MSDMGPVAGLKELVDRARMSDYLAKIPLLTIQDVIANARRGVFAPVSKAELDAEIETSSAAR